MTEGAEREIEQAREEVTALIARAEDAARAMPGREEMAAWLGKIETLLAGARREVRGATKALEGNRILLRGIVSVLGAADAREVLEKAMDGLLLLSGAERGFLVLRGDTRPFDVRVARNVQKRSISSPEFELSRGVLRKAMEENRTVLLANAMQDPELHVRLSILKLKLLSVLAVPLRSGGQVIGAVYLDNRQAAGIFREEVAYQVEELATLVAMVLEGATRRAALEAENAELARRAEAEETLLGEDERWRAAIELARQVAPSNLPVLVTGESGTGKELVARLIHRASPRQRRPFVAVNCAALPKGLAESELFGHVRGAFTGADTARRGRIESAAGGTLFLDEVGSLDIELQGKLLRTLQFGEVQRVGSDAHATADVRVIAASNQDPARLVEQERFRADLFYRLGAVRIALPPLRERGDDIELLALEFLRRFSGQLGRSVVRIEKDALTVLRSYPYPGNVRELQNLVRRAILVARGGAIRSEDLPPEVLSGAAPRGPSAPATREEFLREKREMVLDLERRFVAEALHRGGGNITRSAKAAGIDRSVLSVLARKHKLSLGKQQGATD